MEQMVNREAPVVTRIQYGDVRSGLMRDDQGRIYFLTRRGSDFIRFPVLVGGTIQGESDDFPLPNEWVDLVRGSDLGMTEFRWGPRPAPKKSKTM